MLLEFRRYLDRHGSIELPWRTLFLTAIAVALYVLAGPAPEPFVYSRAAIASGEWWRLITGHWVHSDLQHALWDISALAILGAYSERYLAGRIYIILISASLLISMCIWTFLPWLEYYCGLSGIAHTLLIVGMLEAWLDRRDSMLLMIVTVTVFKTLVEIQSGNAIFTDTAWPSLPLAHLYGLILGVMFIGCNRMQITWPHHYQAGYPGSLSSVFRVNIRLIK